MSSLELSDKNRSGTVTPDVSTIAHLDGYVRPELSKMRMGCMLFLFCFAEFMDAFIGSALFPAIDVLIKDLKMESAEVTWAFAAYSATFAAFLLVSGRIADIYSARTCFIVGAVILGAFSLGGGFGSSKVVFFLTRAFAGIGAAMTVPSALSLIVEWFPDQKDQDQAIAFFGGSGGLGNILGIVLGGVFVQWATWRWIMYFTGILGLGTAIIAILLVPQSAPRERKPSWKRLDLIGVSLITGSLILLVYGVTDGSYDSWSSAKVVTTLVLSVVMGAAFFIWEAYIDEDMACLPPRVWFYKNVAIMVALGLVPFFWWCQLFFSLMPRMQEVYGWSAIMTSVRFLGVGIFGGAVAANSSKFVDKIQAKYAILLGLTFEFIATMILPFSDTAGKYWSHLFPAFIIGTMGTMTVYNFTNIAVFRNTPSSMAGVVGGLYNAALQIGIAVGLAVQASIETSIGKQEAKKGDPTSYKGIRDAFFFTVTVIVVMVISTLVFCKLDEKNVIIDPETGEEKVELKKAKIAA